MNRTERLYAITEELRRAGARGVTGRRLAARFEVSERTVKRDLAALQQAGAPIWTQPGPGGGYVLDATATLPAVNLTPAEAVAVAAALSSRRPGAFAVDSDAALAKLLAVMDPRSRRQAQQLAERVWVNGVAPRPGAAWRTVEEGLRRRLVVAITYLAGDGTTSRRRVEPMELAHTNGHWYLVGWCRSRDAVRWFRQDRIQKAHITTDTAPDRDLAVIGVPPPEAAPVSSRMP